MLGGGLGRQKRALFAAWLLRFKVSAIGTDVSSMEGGFSVARGSLLGAWVVVVVGAIHLLNGQIALGLPALALAPATHQSKGDPCTSRRAQPGRVLPLSAVRLARAPFEDAWWPAGPRRWIPGPLGFRAPRVAARAPILRRAVRGTGCGGPPGPGGTAGSASARI